MSSNPREPRERMEMCSVLGGLRVGSILWGAAVSVMRITCSGIQVSRVLHLRVQLGLERVSFYPFVNIK